MKRVLSPVLCLGLLLLGLAQVQARIGETQKAIEARMGKPLTKVGRAGPDSGNGARLLYYDPGWAIVVTFWNGRSCHEQYYKISPLFSAEVIKEWFSEPGTFWGTGYYKDNKRPATLLQNLGRHSESMTSRDVAEILTANSDGISWKNRQAGTMWISSDGLRQARYFPRAEDGEYLVLTTTAFDRLLVSWNGKGTPPMWPLDSARLRVF